ncbi:unnamed protein product, partial [Rotaria magnacalcarata]
MQTLLKIKRHRVTEPSSRYVSLSVGYKLTVGRFHMLGTHSQK